MKPWQRAIATVSAKSWTTGQNVGNPWPSTGVSVVVELQAKLDIASIRKLINPHLERPLTYNSYKYYIQADDELSVLHSK